MQGQSDSMNEKYEQMESQYDNAQSQVDILEAENEDLNFQIKALENESRELKQKVGELTEQLGYETIANNEEKETLNKALESFLSLTDMKDSELIELLSENPKSKEVLEQMVNADDVVLEMYKYNFVMNKFFFIDVELVGKENRLVINSNQTQIAVNRQDSLDAESRNNKSLEIYDELKELIDNRQGGAEMVIVTLIVRDPEVYQYAYEISWDALRELELGAGGYRLYKTSYTYID